jgi:hypothetical protein
VDENDRGLHEEVPFGRVIRLAPSATIGRAAAKTRQRRQS